MNLTRNILTTVSAKVILLGLALVSSMVLARTLGPEDRGLLALVMLLPELARVLALLGFDQANAVYAGLEPHGRRALVWQSAAVAGMVGGLVALGGVCYVALGAPGFEVLVRGPVWLYAIPLALIPATLLGEYWGAILRGMNHIFLLNLVDVGVRVGSLALILVCVVGLGAGVAGAVWANAALAAGLVVVLAGLLAHSGALGRPWFDRSLWKRTTRFALPAHFSGVMTFLNYRIDQFIIALLLPPEQLAFYVIAVEIAERIWIIPGAVGTALLPHLTNSGKRDPALAAVVARHAILWTGAGCLVVFALAGVAVELVYSSAFAATASPLRWLLPGIFTLAVGKVLVAELLAREKIRYTVWLSVVAVAVNVAANLVLIPRMGIAGAGLASSLSYTLVAVIVMWYYVRETGVPWGALVPRRSDLRVYRGFLRAFRKRTGCGLATPAPALEGQPQPKVVGFVSAQPCGPRAGGRKDTDSSLTGAGESS
jgi:O-antigen/teichoic acid export membrane protein